MTWWKKIFPFFRPKTEDAYSREMRKLLKEIHRTMEGSFKNHSVWRVYDLYGEVDELLKKIDDKKAGERV